MSRHPNHPIPKPRTKCSRDKTEDNEVSALLPPTNRPKAGSVRSSPPPVMPKKVSIKKIPGGSETGVPQMIMVIPLQSNTGKRPPLPFRLPPFPIAPEPIYENMDSTSLLEWWEEKKSWETLCQDLRDTRQIIKVKAQHLYKAINMYIFLLTEHGSKLKEYTSEMLCIADKLDKYSKGTKIAGITGGATTVAGGVAAAAGVILSPVTLGASLALTAVGVGVAAAGGVTGAAAAITNKVNFSLDKQKIDKLFQDYRDLMKKVLDCLKFVNEGMLQLKQHDLSILCEARKDSEQVANMVNLAATGGASARALEANSEAFGNIQGFALALDFYYTSNNGENKVKKGLVSKFANKIRTLAEGLDKALDELIQLKELFTQGNE